MSSTNHHIHLTATADGRVIGVRVDDAENASVIDDGRLVGESIDVDEALATAHMRGGRRSLDRASAEALMAGDRVRAKALDESAQRVMATASGGAEPG